MTPRPTGRPSTPRPRAHATHGAVRRRPVFLAALATALAAVAATVGVAQSGPRTIGVDEIRPGMRGYGLSVLTGTEPERFDVEVIDVLHNFRPDQDLILVRTPHPLLNRARAVGGMSGSPVYLDGRLAGAYAYGWPHGTDPVIGVTPIANMLAELHRPIRPSSFPGAELFPTSPGAPRGASRPAAAAQRRTAALPPTDVDAFASVRADVARLAQARSTGPVGLVPAQTPLMLGGFTDDVAQMLSRELSGLGLDPVQTGGAGRPAPDANARYVDGGSIGVQLVRGDMATTGIGTVTHVGGERVIAFGHPMMNGGETGPAHHHGARAARAHQRPALVQDRRGARAAGRAHPRPPERHRHRHAHPRRHHPHARAPARRGGRPAQRVEPRGGPPPRDVPHAGVREPDQRAPRFGGRRHRRGVPRPHAGAPRGPSAHRVRGARLHGRRARPRPARSRRCACSPS
jgi:hypothetical protein